MITSWVAALARARERRVAVPAVRADALPHLLHELAAGPPVCVVGGADVDPAGLLGHLPPGAELCVPLGHVAAAGELARAAARREVRTTLRVASWTGAAAAVVAEVRRRVPGTGVQLDARLPGAGDACAQLDGRVLLVTGALPAPAGAVPAADADLAAVRCLELLLAGPATVALDGADPALARLAAERAAWHARPAVVPNPRPADTWELLMPYDRFLPAARPGPTPAAPVRLLVPVAGGAR